LPVKGSAAKDIPDSSGLLAVVHAASPAATRTNVRKCRIFIVECSSRIVAGDKSVIKGFNKDIAAELKQYHVT
jgi:hypothetical protein